MSGAADLDQPEPRTALGPAPEAALGLFGDRFGLAQCYAARLASDGVERGLIGPREVPRLWSRHLINSAVLAELVPRGARVIDVGSGAGLPGLPMALHRPDLEVVLVEPMLRRTVFLAEMIDALDLSATVSVVRGRAEDRDVRRELGSVSWVVARAVAPLDRLGRWCLPLLEPGGRLLALKGARAAAEIAEHRASLERLGAGRIELEMMGGDVAEPTWVISVERRARSARRGRNR